jgi:hypothetical protein
MHEGLERLLLPLLDGGADGEFVPFAARRPHTDMDARDWAQRWMARDPEAIAKVDALLKTAGLTMDAVVARTLIANLGQIERLDRMIALAIQRREDMLRELDRRRASRADKQRRATDEVEEADFEIVTAKSDQSEDKT